MGVERPDGDDEFDELLTMLATRMAMMERTSGNPAGSESPASLLRRALADVGGDIQETSNGWLASLRMDRDDSDSE